MKPKRVWFVALVLLLTTSFVVGETLVVTKAGYYLLSQDAAGVPSLTKIDRVLTLDYDPLPPGPIPTPSLTVRATAIRDAALKATKDPIRTTTAHDLATLYREIAKKVVAGEIKGQANIAAVVRMATDKVLEKNLAAEAWGSARDQLSFYWVILTNDGAADSEYAKLLNEAGDGLAASAPNALPQLDLARIIEIIKLIMELLKLIPHEAGSPAGGSLQ